METLDFNLAWTPEEIDNEQELSLIEAVSQIVRVARHSQNDMRLYVFAARPIAYVSDMLGLTDTQTLVYAILMNSYYDSNLSTRDIGSFLGISPLESLVFENEMKVLCEKKYLCKQSEDDSDGNESIYSVTSQAVASLQENRAISIATQPISNTEEWFGAFDRVVVERCHGQLTYKALCKKTEMLIAENKSISFVKTLLQYTESISSDDRMLLLWVCNMLVSDGYATFVPDNFRRLYDGQFRLHRRQLTNGKHILLKRNFLQVASGAPFLSQDCFELSGWTKEVLLSELELASADTQSKDLLSHTAIVPKQLFYNAKEQQAIHQLTSLLQPGRFTQVCNELDANGFRRGFACLFYGAPGTGKTETVLQLARATGRDIMQVNISTIKSKWVGESEQNIKAVFTRYHHLVKNSKVAPILLFNEADAILGKRIENVARSTDKMENAIQNIILEEIERLDGILIATTNLTGNLDKAFERRFLYKIEFEKPSLESKRAIWQSMITSLSDDDAAALATKYDFSGGQIENIARKSIVDRILSGSPLSLERLCGHCDMELLDKGANRKRIGYSVAG